MDAHQHRLDNPFGMDEACTNCPALCESRTNIAHGYGDAGAEFLFVGERPGSGADRTGVPFAGDPAGERLQRALGELGFLRSPLDSETPKESLAAGTEGSGDREASSDASSSRKSQTSGDIAERSSASSQKTEFSGDSEGHDLRNAFLTYLTRCRDPERRPTDEEIRTCEPYLNAEIRMINPEIIVPIGQRTLEALAVEYTTRAPESFDVAAEHATTIRGRGFELVPMVGLGEQTDDQTEAFVEHVDENVLDRDYRQTKGRRGR